MIFRCSIDAACHAGAVGKLGQDRLFFGRGRVFPNCPHAAVAIAEDIVVGHEFDGTRQNAVKKVLCADFFYLFRREYLWFSR